MKQKLHFIAIVFMVGICSAAFGQSSFTDKIPYQAIARNANGNILANQTLTVRVSLNQKGADAEKKSFYSEVHRLQTNEEGYFSIEMGDGDPQAGEWTEIPWYLGKFELDVEIDGQGTSDFQLFSRSELQSVPFAFTAQTADKILKPDVVDERTNFSIHWNTSGNFKTVPHVHFIGTRDDKDFYVKTSEKTRIVFSNRGQMTIYADESKRESGDEETIEDYQLYIKGKEHGAYIELKESRSEDNNYLTFADDGDIRGTIEGQTLGELASSPDFINANLDFAFSLGTQIAITVAEFAQGAGYVAAAAAAGASIFLAWKAPGFGIASGGAFGLGGAAVAATVSIIAQTIEYNVTTLTSVGVSYSSGGADYAEYLLRNPAERDLYPGEIVGVRNGEISLVTDQVDHIMVVSETPAMLGNLPSPQRAELFEKVAFMGQVPVKVIGKVESGDYILPSGNQDGLGIAVKADALPSHQFKQIVGVAWESVDAAPDEINRINISIGLNKNDLAPRVERLESKVDNILDYLEGRAPLHEEVEDQTQLVTTSSSSNTAPRKSFTDAQIDQYIEAGETTIKTYYAMLENRLQKEGINLRDYPVWDNILNDPVAFIKEARKDPAVAQRWANMANYTNSQPE
ncbi:MAG: hypothetical protein Sapg2KO_52410 [Saprospiraceae bacterium]